MIIGTGGAASAVDRRFFLSRLLGEGVEAVLLPLRWFFFCLAIVDFLLAVLRVFVYSQYKATSYESYLRVEGLRGCGEALPVNIL